MRHAEILSFRVSFVSFQIKTAPTETPQIADWTEAEFSLKIPLESWFWTETHRQLGFRKPEQAASRSLPRTEFVLVRGSAANLYSFFGEN